MSAENQSRYATPSDGQFYSPFRLEVDPMQRLLLVNFERDPDEVYVGFEPQAFDDPINGRGMLVLGWRSDGLVDVYHQPSLNMAHKNFDIAARGAAGIYERPLEGAHFDITASGVDVGFAFDDKDGRPVDVVVRETTDKPPGAFAILAPMGSAAERPSALPLVWLYDFAFVRKDGTDLRIRVNGQDREPDALPMPIDWQRVHFMRYAADPFIVTWNPQQDAPLEPLHATDNGATAPDGTVYDLVWHGGHPEIAAMRIEQDNHRLAITFDPPLPDLVHLGDGAVAAGAFAIQPDEPAGVVTGHYQVGRDGDLVNITIEPDGGWEPDVSKWEVRLMFRLIGLFRDWPKSYIWRGQLTLDNGPPHLRSRWERLAGPKNLQLGV